MADILSLFTARKAKARATREITAAQNRAKFGRTKAEKERETAVKALAEKAVDAHKREP